MHDSHDLRLLFPTTFSATCHRAGQAVAQLARTCRLTLTVVHVEQSGERNDRARRDLDVFLRDEPNLRACERVLAVSDDPAGTVASMCRAEKYDLVMAPASERVGLRRLGQLVQRSFRARLLASCPVPLWTAAGCLPAADFARPLRTVACLVDFDDDPAPFLLLVSAFARRVGARVHFLSIIPPIDDGTLADVLTSDAPLLPEAALRRLEATVEAQDRPSIHVASGSRRSGLRRLLARCDADLLFVGPGQASAGFGSRFSRDLDRLPCPVVCLDPSPSGFGGWSFEQAASAAYAGRTGALATAG